jgi:exodeoxyribonuclease-3
MKLATFNANSIRSRMPILVDWLAGNQPDILAIQETKVQDADFPIEPIQQAGYDVVYRGEKSYNGVAILSRQAPDETAFGFDDGKQPDETRLAYARFGDLHFVNTYVPQGRDLEHEMYAYKLDWLKRLRAYFDRHFNPQQPVVWVGDLNVARHPIDVSNPKTKLKHVCYHETVRAAFEEVIAWGFHDVYREVHPEGDEYTFYDYRVKNAMERGLGWRIDYVMVSPAMRKIFSNAWIDLEPRRREKPSDHTFLIAEFTD